MKQRSNVFSDDELIAKYSETPTLGVLAVHFGVPTITIWRRCQKIGLKFQNGGRFIQKFALEDILDGKHPQYSTLKLKNRLIKECVLENKCSCCGIQTWLDKPLSLHLDHIDGDSHNHRLENLRLLCPNCHSQTDTWCGRNK